MRSAVKGRARDAVGSLTGLLARTGVSPMTLTALGVLFSVASGFAFWQGRFRIAAALMFAGGLCDMLDGSVARRAGTATRFGAFIDSSLDRYAEAAVFIGLLLYYRMGGSALTIAATLVALTGSFMVSYTRARAEGLGLQCAVGIMERPERFLVIIVGALLGPRAMPYALAFLAVAANVTAVERMIHVRRETRGG